MTLIHSDYSEAIHILYLIKQAVVESANWDRDIQHRLVFLPASLDIVQAVALILSDPLRFNGNCFDQAAANKYEFKCNRIQLEELAFVGNRTMLWFFCKNETAVISLFYCEERHHLRSLKFTRFTPSDVTLSNKLHDGVNTGSLSCHLWGAFKNVWSQWLLWCSCVNMSFFPPVIVLVCLSLRILQVAFLSLPTHSCGQRSY